MRNGKKVIARVFSAYDGPVDYYLFDRMKMVDPNKFETICIYLKKRSEEPNPLEKEGFKCFYISRQKYFKCFNLVAIFKLARIFKESKVDVLHCNRHQATVYSVMASMFAKVPVILSHVHGLSRSKSLRRKLIYWLLGHKISAFLACSNGVGNDILANFPSVKNSQVIVLVNSIDYDRYVNAVVNRDEFRSKLGIGREDFVFGTVARFGPYKGHSVLIQAFQKVKQQIPAAKVVFVGDGPKREQINEQVKQSGLEDSVHFLGRRSDVQLLLKIFDVFVLPSIGSEGMPLSILEAMSTGVPCISTNISGIPEIINSNKVGMVVDSGDVDSLAEAMLKFCNMPKKDVRLLCEKAQKRVLDNFNHKAVVLQLQEVYSM